MVLEEAIWQRYGDTRSGHMGLDTTNLKAYSLGFGIAIDDEYLSMPFSVYAPQDTGAARTLAAGSDLAKVLKTLARQESYST